MANEHRIIYSKKKGFSIMIFLKHMKRCSKAFIVSKMQIKTRMKYYLSFTRLVRIKKFGNMCVSNQVHWKRP